MVGASISTLGLSAAAGVADDAGCAAAGAAVAAAAAAGAAGVALAGVAGVAEGALASGSAKAAVIALAAMQVKRQTASRISSSCHWVVDWSAGRSGEAAAYTLDDVWPQSTHGDRAGT